MCVQDLGRPGFMAFGLSQGGAADRLALIEGAALLDQDVGLGALEMAGAGGTFAFSHDGRIALTGAPMRALLDGRPLAWNASHGVGAGQRLELGGALKGVFAYLHLGGGIATPPVLGSRSCHLVAGLGEVLAAGAELPLGEDPKPGETGWRLQSVADRFSGGLVRVLPSAQTGLFGAAQIERFQSVTFTRAQRGNRQGVQLTCDGAPFAVAGQLRILSESMVPGDIQMTGEGRPFVLLPECQTTGGYPRIANVIPGDLPIVAQAAPGARLRFRFVSLERALAADQSPRQLWARLRRARVPLVRDPHDIADLLAYQLISGVTAGADHADEGCSEGEEDER